MQTTLYREEFVLPMRQELTSLGFLELKTTAEVDRLFADNTGSLLIVINSVCGCAAANARPAVRLALKHRIAPSKLVTVFAGQDPEPTQRVRDYLTGYPPSSPSMALFKDGGLVFMLQRHQIERRLPEEIAADLTRAFDSYLR